MGWREDAFNNDGPILAQWAKENEHEGRAYKDPATGIQYPSVTTVLKNTPKADMMRWAARVVAERARDRPDIVMGDPDKVVDRLQYAPTDYRNERGWIGSGVHKAVEAELMGIFHMPDDFTVEQERMMDRLGEFLDQYDVEPVAMEVTVLIPCGLDRNGEPMSVMGTLDGLWKVTDRWTGKSLNTLMDLKSSKGIWPEHEYQLAALSKASHWFEQVGSKDAKSEFDPEGDHKVLVHKHPQLKNTFWIKHEGLPIDVEQVRILHLREDGFAWQIVPDIEENFAIYCDYVGLWNNLKHLKDVRSAREFG